MKSKLHLRKVTILVLTLLIVFNQVSFAETGNNVPMDAIDNWDQKYSLFDAGTESAMKNGGNPVYQTAKFLYLYADPTDFVFDKLFERSEQEKQDELMVNLIKENFVTYLDQNENHWGNSEEILEQIESDLEAVDTGYTLITLPLPYHDQFISVASTKLPPEIQTDDKKFMYQITIGAAEIFCETIKDVKTVVLMQNARDCVMEYLDHLTECTAENTSLYRACETVRREINERWPFGYGVPMDLSEKNASEMMNIITNAGYEFLLSSLNQNGDLLIHVVDIFDTAFVNAAGIQFLSGCLIDMKSGAFLGHLITYLTGKAIQEEEDLLRLYIASSEIRNAMRTAPQDALPDVASLYLTAEEAGLRKACDYFVDTGNNEIGVLLRKYITKEQYPSEDTLYSIAQKQIDQLNDIRKAMGIFNGSISLDIPDADISTEQVQALPYSEPEKLYGTWEMDWHQPLMEQRDNAEMAFSMLVASALGAKFIIKIEENTFEYWAYDSYGFVDNLYPRQSIECTIDEKHIGDKPDNGFQWRLSEDEQILYLFSNDTEADKQAIRFFRVGQPRYSSGTKKSDVTGVPYDLRGSWVVKEATVTEPGQTRNLLKDGDKKLHAMVSFTDSMMYFSMGEFTLNEISAEKITLKNNVLESDAGRLLSFQFSDDKNTVAISDNERMHIKAQRLGTRNNDYLFLNYPDPPVYQNSSLLGEWVLIDQNGVESINFEIADSFRTGNGMYQTLVISDDKMTYRYLMNDNGDIGEYEDDCLYTAGYIDAPGQRLYYTLDGDTLTLKQDDNQFYATYVRRGTQAEDEARKKLIQKAIDGYYDFLLFYQKESAIRDYHGYSASLELPRESPEGYPVISVDAHALERAVNAAELWIPGGIGRFEYQYLPALQSIRVEESSKSYISKDGVLFSRDGTKLIMYPAGSGRSVYEIPSGVMTIEHDAFRGAVNLEEIVFPEGLSWIREDAFSGCTGLTQIEFAEKLQGIEAGAFSGCTSLTDVFIPLTDGTSWDAAAFTDCPALKAIHTARGTNAEQAFISAGLPVSADQAYYRYEVREDGTVVVTSDGILPYVDLNKAPWSQLVQPGKTAVLKGEYDGRQWLLEVFEDHSELTLLETDYPYNYQEQEAPWRDYLEIIRTVWYQEADEFRWSLDSGGTLRITGEGDMPAFRESETYDDGYTERLVYYYKSPWPVGQIRSIEMDGRITSISGNAFSACTALRKMVIPDSVQLIDEGAFKGCSSLSLLFIPESVREISEDAFDDCVSLQTIHCPAGSYTEEWAKSKGYLVSNNMDTGLLLSDVLQKGEYENISWQITGSYELIISGSGNMPENITGKVSWGKFPIRSVVVQNGITSIAPGAFRSFAELTNAVLPADLQTIGAKAFSGCRNLGSLIIPRTVTSIGDEAFSGTGLTSVTIPEGITVIGARLFASCGKLASVSLPDSVVKVQDYAFERCYALKSISFTNQKLSLGGYVFKDCTSLEQVILPDKISSVGMGVFTDCKNLKMEKVPNLGGKLPHSLFSGCMSLTELELADGIYRINQSVFKKCYGLQCITLPYTINYIDSSAFDSCVSLTKVKCVQGTYADEWAKGRKLQVEYIPMSTPVPTATPAPTFTPAPVTTPLPAAAYMPETVSGEYVTRESDYSVRSTTVYYTRETYETFVNNNIKAYTGSDPYVLIPSVINGNTITEIGSGAFRDNKTIEKVIIPEGITSIGPSAFSGCTSLKEISLPATISWIADSAFENCTSLRSVFIPTDTRIESFAFANCTALETIAIQGPSADTNRYSRRNYYDYNGNFIEGCTALKQIITPEDFLYFQDGFWFYYDYAGLRKTIIGNVGGEPGETYTVPDDVVKMNKDVIGSTVRELIVPDSASVSIEGMEGKNLEVISLGENAYIYTSSMGAMPKLREISVSKENKYFYVRDGVLFHEHELVRYPAAMNPGRTSYTVPEGVQSICPNAFAYSGLKELILPTTLGTIGFDFGMAGLEHITIPSSVTSIMPYIFNRHYAPNFISARVEKGSYAEQFCTENQVPYEYYEAAPEADENELDYVTNEADYIWRTDYKNENELVITAYLGTDLWVRIPDQINGLPVTGIDSRVFADNIKIRKIIVPEGIKEINNNCFLNCASLTEIMLPDSLTSLGNAAFKKCARLAEIRLPGSLKSIGNSAFEDCTALKSISLPPNVYLDAPFKGCSSLETIELQGDIRVSRNPLLGCTGVKQITDPDGAYVFEDGILYRNNGDGTIALIGRAGGEEGETYVVPEPASSITYDFIGETVRELIVKDETHIKLGNIFSSAKNLERIRLGANTELESIGTLPKLQEITVSPYNERLFTQDGVLFARQYRDYVLLKYPAGSRANDTVYRVPKGTTNIGMYSFYGTSVKELILPPTVRTIASYAFRAGSIEYITIPASVTSIDYKLECDHLKCVYVEKSSYAEKYCLENGYPYSYIETASVNPTLIPEDVRAALRAPETPNTPALTDDPAAAETAGAAPQITAAPLPAAGPSVSPAPSPTVSAAPEPMADPATESSEDRNQPASVPDAYQPVEGYQGICQARISHIEAPYIIGKNDPKAYIPEKMTDGRDSTSWQFSTKKNKLKKTYIVITFSEPADISSLWIKNGSWRDDSKINPYTANSRIKDMDVRFRYGDSEWKDKTAVRLSDDKSKADWQKIDLGEHTGVTAVQLCINSIYKGSKYSTDVCVTELMFIH